MNDNNRGPIGIDWKLPKLDTQTLSLRRNAAKVRLGFDDTSHVSLMNRKPVQDPLFSETAVGFCATFYFDIDSFLLDSANYQALQQLNRYIQLHSHQILQIDIEGHTSTTGSEKHNLRLSKNRIESVTLLLALNDATLSIKKYEYGESRPAVAEDGKGQTLEYQRSKNRRVEINGYWELLPSSKTKSGIDLFPKDVLQKIADQDLIQYMLKLPSLDKQKPKLIFEDYVKRLFDKIYDPTLGKLEKKIIDSKIGKILKFFGVKALKGPIRDKVLSSLYDLLDKSATDPKVREAIKNSVQATMKTNWNR